MMELADLTKRESEIAELFAWGASGYSQQIDPHKIIKNAPLVIMWCLLSQMGVLGMSSGLF